MYNRPYGDDEGMYAVMFMVVIAAALVALFW